MKNIFLKICIITAGFAIAALIIEASLRIFYPQKRGSIEQAYDLERGGIPVPNQCGWTDWPGVYSYRRCNNSVGLRGTKEYNEIKQNFRILLL